MLLLASYGFYLTLNAPYLLASLIMVTAISYVCALRLGACRDEPGRQRWYWGGVTGCLGILILLKYFPFLETNVTGLFGFNASFFKTFITIGVSYYSLQAISYLTDIYLETCEPESDLGIYALYLAFFPKLLQGPIERATDLLPQLKKTYEFSYDNMRAGLLLFSWGLFKKVVVADRLSIMVNSVYSNVHAYSGFPLILATYLYALQIYFDFSGYTDMALGCARVFNISLTPNFNAPYLATSVADFWRRWHMSFSRWILDYIFKPLQFQLRSRRNYGTAIALIVTFLVSGMWHGASWNFLVWGGLHGIFLAASVFYKPLQKSIFKGTRFEKSIFRKVMQIFITFNLICFAWIFFRASTLSDAWYVTTHLFAGSSGDVASILLVSGKISLMILLLSHMVLLLVGLLAKYTDLHNTFFEKPLLFRWLVYYALCSLLLVCSLDGDNIFVYFKF